MLRACSRSVCASASRPAGLAAGLLAFAGCTPARDVLPVYLTWSDEDTTTTMTVQYHTLGPFDGTHVYYDTQPRHGELARYASHARGFERRIEGVDRVVHVVPLTRLTPGTTYWFVAGDPTSGFREERSFRTLPADGSPVRFVAGGDMSTGWLPRLTSWLAARTDPSFALIGGDLAYCRGLPEGYARWQQWFADWEATMHTPDGRLIPIVAAIGNHDRRDIGDTRGGSDPAPFFNGFFYQDPAGKSYFARRFGPRVALFVLDSGHLAPQAGAQRDWLAAELRENADVPVRFALYHVALFPAHQPISKSVACGASRMAAALRRLPPDGRVREPRPSPQAHAAAARRRARRRWQRHGLLRRRMLGQVAPEGRHARAELPGDRVRAPPLLEGDRVGAGRELRSDRRLRARLRSSRPGRERRVDSRVKPAAVGGSARVARVRFVAEHAEAVADAVAVEEPLEIQLGGAALAVVMRTPGHDEELALGFLVTERVVAAPEQVLSVRHCRAVADPDASENVVRVLLAAGVEVDLDALRRNLYASSSCGICGKATIANALVSAPPLEDDEPLRRSVLLGAARSGSRRCSRRSPPPAGCTPPACSPRMASCWWCARTSGDTTPWTR